ncbi:hypothetical protein B0H63DRAFT_482876 [Podospora didyma]|uniref:Uncharacterized protein n=1 Tax=Podospora didyma TaxID=330526 RepID=A0AAE0KGM5_9PEZI|nr:hypothetical protein B0H63DRAFT_482876 [Podospora didyma]
MPRSPTRRPPQPPIRYRWTAVIVAVLYLTVLIVPWILTCLQAYRPFGVFKQHSSSKYDTGDKLGIQPQDATITTKATYILEALNILAVVASLPVIHLLFSRAAVVFSQRTSTKQTLNATQLFHLADQRFLLFGMHCGWRLAALAAVWVVLVVTAIALPVMRAALVHTELSSAPRAKSLGAHGFPEDWWSWNRIVPPNKWDSVEIGTDASLKAVTTFHRRIVVEKVRQAMVVSHPDEWQREAPRDPNGDLYASRISPKTSTGMHRHHALRMSSTANCSVISNTTFPRPCPGPGWDWDFSYNNPNLTFHVCFQGESAKSPWRSDRKTRQDIQEHFYVNNSAAPAGSRNSYPPFRCSGNTSLGYFELPSYHNGEVAGPLLRELPQGTDAISAGFADNEMFSQQDYSAPPVFLADLGDDDRSVFTGSGQTGADPSLPTPGPLLVTLLSLLGEGSYFALTQNITDRNSQAANMLALLCPSMMPFRRVYSYFQTEANLTPIPGHTYTLDNCLGIKWTDETDWNIEMAQGFLHLISTSPDLNYASYPNTSTEILESGMYFANQALLEASAIGRNGLSANLIFYNEGLKYRKFTISQMDIIAISVVLTLHALVMIGLLGYIYSAPTWTATLDALAIARLTPQLKDDGAIWQTGLKKVDVKFWRQMERVDALVGVVEPAIEMEEGLRSRASGDTTGTIARPAASAHANSPSATLANGQALPLRRRVSITAGDQAVDDNENGYLPPAYAPPRHGGQASAPIPSPPAYEAPADQLSLPELRLGAPGLVTRDLRLCKADPNPDQVRLHDLFSVNDRDVHRTRRYWFH